MNINNIAIFKNFEIYNTCYPNENRDDFLEYNNPLYRALIGFHNNKDKEIRFCIIDEDFLVFKEEHNLEDIEASLQTYMKNITDEKACSLWNSNIYKNNIELLLYPFLIINEYQKQKTEYKLDQKTSDILTKYILNKTNLKEDDIYIPGYVNTFQTAIDLADSMMAIGEEYLYNKKLIKYPIMEYQENNIECNMFTYCIPIFIKKDISYKLDKNFVAKILSGEGLKIQINHEEIKKIINLEESILPLTDCLVYVDDLKDIFQDLEDLINKEIKRKKSIFNIFRKK